MLSFAKKGTLTKWFRRDCIRPKSDVSRWCVRLVPQFGSEFAEGWVVSAETTFLLPRIAAIETVPFFDSSHLEYQSTRFDCGYCLSPRTDLLELFHALRDRDFDRRNRPEL